MFQFNFISNKLILNFFYRKQDLHNLFTKVLKPNSILLVKIMFNQKKNFYKII